MKYSLRSLMIGITLVCIVLGAVAGRIEYLRRWAAYHEREEQIWIDRVRDLSPGGAVRAGIDEDLDAALFAYASHRRLKLAYRVAIYRPWTVVEEPEIAP